ncbi:AraC family two component transcriptional regulator [Hydrogenispora ethanolica]|uniref:AraC family two component transcriptional regulator n=1 Tax=Hydrogenispora ethanolica TaxID=1082276 RepID=A0A4V2QCZ2_HYDET|nr:response regulator [Hydrogenispora ethanolica]TCL61777.1 AraC family two component transcriptional regulator [Hydrogenispora ethanolica]
MFKILIVDDEALIRNGIAQAVPWRELAIDEVRTAAGGAEALALMDSWRPDVVLTDIRMPGLDGLELLDRVRQLNPEAKVVILSGFDDFAYAQAALKLGAFDYLLKTSDIHDLVEVLGRALAALRSDREKQRRLELATPLLRERYLNRLLYGGHPPAEFHEGLRLLGPGFGTASFLIALAELRSPEVAAMSDEDREFGKVLVMEVVEELLGDGGSGFEGRDDELIVLGMNQAGLPEAAFREEFGRCCQQLLEAVAARFGLRLSIGISLPNPDWQTIRQSYHQAKQALECTGLAAGKIAWFEAAANRCAAPTRPISSGQEKVLLAALRVGDRAAVLESVQTIIGGIAQWPPIRLPQLRQTGIELFSIALRVLPEFEIDAAELYGKDFLYFEEMQRIGSLEQLRQWLFAKLTLLADYIRDHKILKHKQVVEEARSYMAEHYHEPLTLNRLAGVVHMSPNYFSSVFSNELGQSFLEYLTELRVEKAKQRLGDPDAKAFEVGAGVGYENPQYFSKIFKKYTGMTPTEYREALRRERCRFPEE